VSAATGNYVSVHTAIEAVQHTRKNSPMRAPYDRIVERRGAKAKNIAKVAAARKLLALVYYGLRDGEIRCLTERVVDLLTGWGDLNEFKHTTPR
jgi:hypothetical protein